MNEATEIDYSAFRQHLKAGNVAQVTVTGNEIQGELKEPLEQLVGPPGTGKTLLARAVAGWRGPLAEGNRQWWVAARDFGTAPFRWNITEGSGGRLVGASQTFNLPNQANETLWVTVLLTP